MGKRGKQKPPRVDEAAITPIRFDQVKLRLVDSKSSDTCTSDRSSRSKAFGIQYHRRAPGVKGPRSNLRKTRGEWTSTIGSSSSTTEHVLAVFIITRPTGP